MNLVSVPFRVISALIILSFGLFLSCSTSTEPEGDIPPPLNRQPSVPKIDSDNGAPANNAFGTAIDTKLRWTSSDPDGDTLVYDVYFGIDNPPGVVATDISETVYDPVTLEYDTVYYWRVVAKDGYNHLVSSPVWQFTTAAPPNDPVIEITPKSLDFGLNLRELEFTIKNVGTGKLDWTIGKSTGAGWLQHTPPLGTTSSGESAVISVTVDRSGLPSRPHAAHLIVVSNNGKFVDTIQVSMDVSPDQLGDWTGIMDLNVYSSGLSARWIFDDSIRIYFELFVNSDDNTITGTGNGGHDLKIVPKPDCTSDSLVVVDPFDVTLDGSAFGDSLRFTIVPDNMLLSFTMECDGQGVPVLPYGSLIASTLDTLELWMAQNVADTVKGYIPDSVPDPDMTYTYTVIINKR